MDRTITSATYTDLQGQEQSLALIERRYPNGDVRYYVQQAGLVIGSPDGYAELHGPYGAQAEFNEVARIWKITLPPVRA